MKSNALSLVVVTWVLLGNVSLSAADGSLPRQIKCMLPTSTSTTTITVGRDGWNTTGYSKSFGMRFYRFRHEHSSTFDCGDGVMNASCPDSPETGRFKMTDINTSTLYLNEQDPRNSLLVVYQGFELRQLHLLIAPGRVIEQGGRYGDGDERGIRVACEM